MKEYNPDALRAEVAAGYKGGNMFQKLITHPQMTVVDGVAETVKKKLGAKPTPQIPMQK